MGLRSKLFALVYDRQMAKTEAAGLHARREALLAEVHGDVLEIGAGTGLNLSIYGPEVTSLTLTEPEPPMIKRLQKRAADLAPPRHRPAGAGRGPALRGRLLRRRRLDAGALRRERPAPRAARDPPRAAAWG